MTLAQLHLLNQVEAGAREDKREPAKVVSISDPDVRAALLRASA